MNNAEHLQPQGRHLLDRRSFLRTAGLSTSSLAFLQMLQRDGLLAETVRTAGGKDPIRPQIDPNDHMQLERPTSQCQQSRSLSSTARVLSVMWIRLITNQNSKNSMDRSHQGFQTSRLKDRLKYREAILEIPSAGRDRQDGF